MIVRAVRVASAVLAVLSLASCSCRSRCCPCEGAKGPASATLAAPPPVPAVAAPAVPVVPVVAPTPKESVLVAVPALPAELIGTWGVDGLASADILVAPMEALMKEALERVSGEQREVAEMLLPDKARVREVLARRLSSIVAVSMVLDASGGATLEAKLPGKTSSASGRWDAHDGRVWITLAVSDGKPATGKDLVPQPFDIDGKRLRGTWGSSGPTIWFAKATAEATPGAKEPPVVALPTPPKLTEAPAPPITSDDDLVGTWGLDVGRMKEPLAMQMEERYEKYLAGLALLQRQIAEDLKPAPARYREVFREVLSRRIYVLRIEGGGAVTLRTTEAGKEVTLAGTWAREGARFLVTWVTIGGDPITGPLAGLHAYDIEDGELTAANPVPGGGTLWIRKR